MGFVDVMGNRGFGRGRCEAKASAIGRVWPFLDVGPAEPSGAAAFPGSPGNAAAVLW
jgi:hypothetical protein